MLKVFHQNKLFYLLFLLYFIPSCIIIFTTDKVKLHLFFNKLVHPYFNSVFTAITHMGDGLFTLFITFVLLFRNVRVSITILVAYAISAGFTQGIKYAFFADADRPTLYFEELHIPLTKVWDDNLIHHSFPSGHATAAFSLFFVLAFVNTKNWIKAACFFIALAIAFSRVYLSQHFFEDITAGSSIAVVFSTFVCWFFYYSRFALKLQKLDKPIFRLF